MTNGVPNDGEVLKKLQLLMSYKSSKLNDIRPAFYRDIGELRERELPDLYQLKILNNSICLIIAAPQRLLISSSNTMLVMLRFSSVLGCSDDNSIGFPKMKHRFQWLDHILQISSQQPPQRTSFADTGSG